MRVCVTLRLETKFWEMLVSIRTLKLDIKHRSALRSPVASPGTQAKTWTRIAECSLYLILRFYVLFLAL